MRANVATKSRFINPDPERLLLAHNAFNKAFHPQPVYFIERAAINADKVEVFFIEEETLNSGIITETDWKFVTISLVNLESFAISEFGDASVCSDITVAHFIDYNLHETVKAYLEAGKEFNHGV